MAEGLTGLSRWFAAQREGMFATAVFAGILAFAVVSLNYLISGGPDWNPGAPPARVIAAPAPPASLPRVDVAAPPPPAPVAAPAVEFLGPLGPVGDLLGDPGQAAALGENARAEPAEDEEFNRAVDQISRRNQEAVEALEPWPEKPTPPSE
jgi:hypothetical protein